MAEEKRTGGDPAPQSNTLGNMKDAAKLARDVGRVASGDMSAVKDLIRNQLLWKIVLCCCLVIAMVGMILGPSFTGVLASISASWQEHWQENEMDQAITSAGDKQYLKTTGWVLTLTSTVEDVVKDLYNQVLGKDLARGLGTSDNSQIDSDAVQAAGRNPQLSDYEKTMQAISDGIVLNQALTDRLDMIKGRVLQRGIQIQEAVKEQYLEGRDSQYEAIVNDLIGKLDKQYTNSSGTVVLYAGYNEELAEENFSFDLSVFELTDLQALKILAIFSIQHDCQLTEMDMWTLMDYCGWYDASIQGELDDVADSIYETAIQTQTYGSDMGNVVDNGDAIPLAIYEFPALQVPVWTGTCAPQWYYEQLAQIREHNQNYLQNSDEKNTASGNILWGHDANAYQSVDTTAFAALSEVQTYGIIDKLYYSAENNLTINRSEYTSAKKWSQEQIRELGPTVYNFWKKYVWGRSKSTIHGTVSRTDGGEHRYYYGGTLEAATSETTVTETVITVPIETEPATTVPATTDPTATQPTMTEPQTEEIVITTKTVVTTSYHLRLENASGTAVGVLYYSDYPYAFYNLNGSSTYYLYRIKTVTTRIYENEELKSQATDKTPVLLEYFTTFPNARNAVAYEMYASVNLTFKARTVDEIAFDLLGIWPGSLGQTTQAILTTPSGNLVGKVTGSQTEYRYCLTGGYYNLQDKVGTGINIPEGIYRAVSRPTSSFREEDPPYIRTVVTEYGITSSSGLSSVSDTPLGGWRRIEREGQTLVFSISPGMRYQVYARVTVTKTCINADGTSDVKLAQALYKIDEFYYDPQGTYSTGTNIENGVLYAAEHFGNPNLRLNWSDIYTDDAGTEHTLQFERITGHQYETYVDLVMALCELLGVSYEDWEPAVARAAQMRS